MQLDPMPISTDKFTSNKKTRWMVTEHSDIRPLRAFKGWDRLYDDACDVGIVLRNPETGVCTRWVLHDEVLDADRDLQVTIFKPCSETLRTQPQLEGWEVHILND